MKAAETAFEIVETLDELETAGLSELAKTLSIAKGTVQKHLATLEKAEYVVREEGEYEVPAGHRPARRGDRRGGLDGHRGAGSYGVYANKALGDRAVPSRGGIGERVDLHSAAIGKALLANPPSERIDEVIERHDLAEMTVETITDREALLAELEEIREPGVAFNDGESLEGLRAVASPVERDGEPEGATAVASAANRMKGSSSLDSRTTSRSDRNRQ